MVAAHDPIIVGTKDPKIESPRGANGPMRPVLIPLTASLELTPSFSSKAKSTSDNGVEEWRSIEELRMQFHHFFQFRCANFHTFSAIVKKYVKQPEACIRSCSNLIGR